ncbi:asparagine synthase [Aureococcus anophagefferens]|nr:asparagine synthase [Aureococcus anophagefferens]
MCGIAALVYGDDAAAPADATRAVLEFATRCGLERRGPDGLDAAVPAPRVALAASVLRMRRTDDWRQPVVDGRGNALAWNGEWFDGDGAPPALATPRRSQKCSARRRGPRGRGGRGGGHGGGPRGPRPRALRGRVLRRGRRRCCSAGPARGRRVRPAERAFGVASAVPRGAAGWAEVPTDGVRSRRGLEAPWPRSGFYDAVSVASSEHRVRPPPAAARLRAALSGAVARRVAGHDDVAVLFSGGLDSACGVCCRPCRADGAACRAPAAEDPGGEGRGGPARRRRARRRRPGARRRRRARGASCSAWARTSLAGYARHRTAYARGGAPALAAELDGDLVRLASRNLGRDDRVVSHHGREARFRTSRPCSPSSASGAVADLDEPPGVGAKRVLRDVAADLGLQRATPEARSSARRIALLQPALLRLEPEGRRHGGFDVDLLLARIEGGVPGSRRRARRGRVVLGAIVIEVQGIKVTASASNLGAPASDAEAAASLKDLLRSSTQDILASRRLSDHDGQDHGDQTRFYQSM